MTKTNDHPFDDVVKTAQQYIGLGAWIFQKFSCAHCRARQTIEQANVLHTHGTCQECGCLTDIRAQGCNYMMIQRPGKAMDPEAVKAMGLEPPPREGLTIADSSNISRRQ